MEFNFWWLLLPCALGIILVLSVIAFRLLQQLKQQTQAEKDALLAQEKSLKQHDKKVIDSVVIIVRAMKEQQCDLSEGCWRLSVLLDSLKLSDNLSQQFPAIFQLYHGIKHMPILSKRKQLTKKERMKLDFQRMKLESQLSDKISQDLALLHQYAIERISALQ